MTVKGSDEVSQKGVFQLVAASELIVCGKGFTNCGITNHLDPDLDAPQPLAVTIRVFCNSLSQETCPASLIFSL